MGEDGSVTSDLPSVVVVGPGRAGGSLARPLALAGVPVPALGTRGGGPHPVAEALGVPTCSPSQALERADVVVLAVPDDAIAGLAEELAASVLSLWGTSGRGTSGRGASGRGASGVGGRPLVAHLSGALGLAPLRALADVGLPVAAWHVLQAFPSADTGVRPGVLHAVTAEVPASETVLAPLVHALGGRLLDLADADRARYHAAAVLAANGTAGVMVAASRLLEECGLEMAGALDALDPLVDSAREAVVRRGIPGGLTGPWVRGDEGTVESHRQALGGDDDVLALYEVLARVVRHAARPASRGS